MTRWKRKFHHGALCGAIVLALLAGCSTRKDVITQAEKKDVAAGVPAPGIAETKAIAEEGFIYGLPIVMNYAVMYDYVIDRNSGQWKAPFNEISNEHRVFTYQDTTIVTPNSDTPYSMVWLDLRAAAAKAGIYGNDAAEAMYPMTKTLEDGSELDGSKSKYTLTLAKDQYPPVNAFWSVTMYDGKTQLLIKNPINRSLVNSPMLPSLKKNKDGSLTLYIQKDSPGKAKEANWLPAPDGPIYLVMRLYWPKVEPPSILPPGEGTWQPPGIVKVN